MVARAVSNGDTAKAQLASATSQSVTLVEPALQHGLSLLELAAAPSEWVRTSSRVEGKDTSLAQQRIDRPPEGLIVHRTGPKTFDLVSPQAPRPEEVSNSQRVRLERHGHPEGPYANRRSEGEHDHRHQRRRRTLHCNRDCCSQDTCTPDYDEDRRIDPQHLWQTDDWEPARSSRCRCHHRIIACTTPHGATGPSTTESRPSRQLAATQATVPRCHGATVPRCPDPRRPPPRRLAGSPPPRSSGPAAARG